MARPAGTANPSIRARGLSAEPTSKKVVPVTEPKDGITRVDGTVCDQTQLRILVLGSDLPPRLPEAQQNAWPTAAARGKEPVCVQCGIGTDHSFDLHVLASARRVGNDNVVKISAAASLERDRRYLILRAKHSQRVVPANQVLQIVTRQTSPAGTRRFTGVRAAASSHESLANGAVGGCFLISRSTISTVRGQLGYAATTAAGITRSTRSLYVYPYG